MNRYVERKCPRCEGGRIHVGASDEVRTDDCPDCNGTGKVLTYLYPKPKSCRGPWPPEEIVVEGRHTEGAS